VRRLKPVLDHYRLSFADVGDLLHIFPLAELEDLAGATGQLLATVGRDDGLLRPTALYNALLAQASEIQPICIVIDNVADVYGG